MAIIVNIARMVSMVTHCDKTVEVSFIILESVLILLSMNHFQLVSVTSSEQMELSSTATDTPVNAHACRMLEACVAMSALRIIGRLRVEKDAKLVVVMRSVPEANSATR